MRIHVAGRPRSELFRSLLEDLRLHPDMDLKASPEDADAVLRLSAEDVAAPWWVPTLAAEDAQVSSATLILGNDPYVVHRRPGRPCLSLTGSRYTAHPGPALVLRRALERLIAPDLARVITLASEPHYVDHMAPVLRALPAGALGVLVAWARPVTMRSPLAAALRSASWGLPTAYFPSSSGVPGPKGVLRQQVDPASSVMLIASGQDRKGGDDILPGRLVRVEHGAGQTYRIPTMPEGHPAFAGGPGHAGLLGATAPTHALAHLIEERRGVPCLPVGCPWAEFLRANSTPPPREGVPKVVLSLRYPGGESVVPELGSAWPHCAEALTALAQAPDRVQLFLHAHPRAWDSLPGLLEWASENRVPVLREFQDALEQADVLVVDNSSAALEWLHVRKHGLVLMDGPGYRRWSKHGLRFWDMLEWSGVAYAPTPGDLPAAIRQALDDRESAPDYYEMPREGASEASARFLCALLGQEQRKRCRILRTNDGAHGLLIRGTLVTLPAAEACRMAESGLIEIDPRTGQHERRWEDEDE